MAEQERGMGMRVSTIDIEKNGMIQGRDNYQHINPGFRTNINRQEEENIHLKEELENSIQELNKTLEALHKDLRFQVHEKSERLMVEVIDLIKNEVIKEIPPRELLDMLGRIREMVGLIIDEKI